MAVFAGMRGTGDFATDTRPFAWRKDILRIKPNGSCPLTGLTGNMKSIVVKDPKYYSFSKVLPEFAADLSDYGVYSEASLTTQVSAAAATKAGATVYCKMVTADALQFKIRHLVLLRDSDNLSVDLQGEVTAVVRGATYGYIAVELHEDDNTSAPDLSTVDRVMVIGTINPEGGTPPPPQRIDPSSDYNVSQIWWNSISQTGTALATELRTPDDYKEAIADCWEIHGIDMEKSGLYAKRYEGTDSITGLPKRTSRGLIPTVQADAYAGTYSCKDYKTLTTETDLDYDFTGKEWTQAGHKFIELMLKRRARFSVGSDCIAFCGDGALLGVQFVCQDNAMMTLETKQTSYGIEIRQWRSVFGTINLILHPLFSHEKTDNYRMVGFESSEVMFRPLQGRDTKYLTDPNFEKGGLQAIDSKNEGIRTEGGWDYGNMRGAFVWDGIGQKNTQ